MIFLGQTAVDEDLDFGIKDCMIISVQVHRTNVKKIFIASLWIGLLGFSAARTGQAETSILAALMQAAQAVVTVEAENAQMTRGPAASIRPMKWVRTGTGILVDSSGWVAANAHTVVQAARIRVHLADGRSYIAEPARVDRENDLALFKIKTPQALPALRLADSSSVTLRSRIYSIGGSNLLKNTLSEGRITGIGVSKARRKPPGKAHETGTARVFQLNLDLYQGDSGSPVFNEAGEVIGIISAAAQRRGRTAFAIPSNLIAQHLAALTRAAKNGP